MSGPRYKFATPANAANGSAMIYDDPAGQVVARTVVDMGHMALPIVMGLNYCEALAKALEACLEAYAEPNYYDDPLQLSDSMFLAIERTKARELIAEYRKEVPANA